MVKRRVKTGALILIFVFLNLNCVRNIKKVSKDLYEVKGIVSYKDTPLEGAVVDVYSEAQVLKNGFLVSDEPFVSLNIDRADGGFFTNLPSGNYYFFARKTGSGKRQELNEGDFFCYFGGNPVAVFNPGQELFLKCAKIHLLKETDNYDSSKTKLTGRIIDIDGKPLERAYVSLFSISNPDFRRIADIVSEPTSKDGQFSIYVSASGSYFLIVRKRQSGQDRGPVRSGDYYGYYHANPIEIKEGRNLFFIIECLEKKKDLITSSNPIIIPSGMSAVRGKIIDKKGNPVEGVFAFVYKNEFNTGVKPDYKSSLTSEDGIYTILISQEGTYILGARKTYGGPPEPEDIFGFYGGAEDNRIIIKKGEIKENINIIVEGVK